MIMREEIGSGEYIDPKGRLFLRSGMPEYSYLDDFRNSPKAITLKRVLIEIGFWSVLFGVLIFLTII